MLRRIKPGYIIIFVIVIFSLYSYKSCQASKYESSVVTKVTSILEDLQKEDYFSFQNKLEPNLKSKISIDDIKSFSKNLDLNGSAKFKLKELKKDNNKIIVEGKVNNLDSTFIFIESNNTLYLLQSKINNHSIKDINFSFPIKPI